jgi:hypothetical protein
MGRAVAVVVVGVVVAAAGAEEQAGQTEESAAKQQHGGEVEAGVHGVEQGGVGRGPESISLPALARGCRPAQELHTRGTPLRDSNAANPHRETAPPGWSGAKATRWQLSSVFLTYCKGLFF